MLFCHKLSLTRLTIYWLVRHHGLVPASRGSGGDVADGLVSSAEAELYAADPDQFTARRKELVTAARKAGDAAAARAIGALAKPTRSAWVVNKLVRSDPTVPDRIADLGDKLRAGEAALDGAIIRELSKARRELITSLVRRALAEAGHGSPSVALRDEVTETISAALADPDVAQQVAAGTLTRAAHWAGFGAGIGVAPAPSAGRTPGNKATPTPAARKPSKAEDGQAERERARADRQAERQRAHERAVADAERAAMEAAQAADAATATEQEVAESVRFMEERLNRERQRLIAARRRAREAVAAADRAKTALDRLRR